MKTKYTLIILVFILIELSQISAQTPITIHTPRGSNVYAHTRPELMDDQDKGSLSDAMVTN
ncbi:hypothetical protein ES705_36079 [subsurface metagenome]